MIETRNPDMVVDEQLLEMKNLYSNCYRSRKLGLLWPHNKASVRTVTRRGNDPRLDPYGGSLKPKP